MDNQQATQSPASPSPFEGQSRLTSPLDQTWVMNAAAPAGAEPPSGRSAGLKLASPADAAAVVSHWADLGGEPATKRPGPGELAQRGVASAGQPLPHKSAVQAAFGRHDVSRISTQIGGPAAAAARGLGTEAYAVGEQIGFSREPSLFVAAHEAAHVVQQRAGVSLLNGEGKAGDAYEQHANEVAAAVVAGQSAESVLDRMAGAGTGAGAGAAASTPQVQRFESDEHARIGDNGARDSCGNVAMVELAPGYSISNGEMVAMAGDFFASIDQMRRMAANPGTGAGTREEIEYVRAVKVRKGPADRFSRAAQDAVEARYYKLAASNGSHFPNATGGDRSTAERAASAPDPASDLSLLGIRFPPTPKNAIEGYRYNHVRALAEAAAAGKSKEGVDSAMATEAFGAHFLTDSFSAGHLRTERQNIKEFWDAKLPMFFYNLKGFMAEEIAKRIASGLPLGPLQIREDVVYEPPVGQGSKQIIQQKLDAIGPLGFGDLVSGAVHDYDNEHGVKATAEGADVTLYGDGKAGRGDEERLAVRAVAQGRAEIMQAFSLGAAGSAPNDVVHQLLGSDRLYAAERLIPKAKPDAEQEPHQRKIQWQRGGHEELLADPQFHRAATIFANEKAATITEVASSLSKSQQQAVDQGVVTPLRSRPIETVRTIINWTPSLTDSALGHNTDDHSLDYWKEAKKTPGGLRSLTYPQRERLLKNLLDGITVGDEEDAVMDVLQTASGTDARRLIKTFGWKRLYDEIDNGQGEKFKDSYPETDYGS